MGVLKVWQKVALKFTSKESLLLQIEKVLSDNCDRITEPLRDQLDCLSPLELATLVSKVGDNLTPMLCYSLKNYAMETGAGAAWLELLAKGKKPQEKSIVIEAIGLLRISQGSWPLVEVIKGSNESLQLVAVKALLRLNTRPLIPGLIDALKEGQFWLPARVAPIIMSWPELAVPMLYQLLEQEGLEDKVYLTAIDMLEQGAGEELLGFLTRIFPVHQEKVQLRILEVASEVGGMEAEKLVVDQLASANNQLRLRAVTAVAKLKVDGWQELIAPLAGDEYKKIGQTVNWLLSN